MVCHAGKDDSHIHAANRGMADRIKKRARGNKIRARDPQAPGCTVDRREINGRADAPVLGWTGGNGKDGRLSAVCEGWRWEAQWGDLVGCVVPILQKRELKSCHSGPFDSKMRVTPWAKSAAPAHVFVADIQTAEKGNTGVCDNQLAVVAEVDLEVSAKLPVRDECLHLDSLAAEIFSP